MGKCRFFCFVLFKNREKGKTESCKKETDTVLRAFVRAFVSASVRLYVCVGVGGCGNPLWDHECVRVCLPWSEKKEPNGRATCERACRGSQCL